MLYECLLIFGLFFGGFSIPGTLAEAPISHAEVAYIELLTERISLVEEIATEPFTREDTSVSRFSSPFYAFSFRDFHQAYLIHHNLARIKMKVQFSVFHSMPDSPHYFILPHVPSYSQDDFPIAKTA